ncbi:MAG TPA: hypothetical protein VHD89_04195 [Rhodanobacteraceae bacterium]|jgi:hypothetical protein|nr:hypothetical protein [Rhodanobacteraceae bacterium]
MSDKLPPTAVVRVSRGNFDPARFDEVARANRETEVYLVPAIKRLPGLIQYFATLSPSGSSVHVSIWESDAHAQQMNHLKEMVVDARRAFESVGVEFTPIVNYPVTWTI